MTDQNGNEVSREEFLDWLKHMPGYKEVIRQRISDEQRRRRELDTRILAHHIPAKIREEVFGTRNRGMKDAVTWQDHDDLGQEVEGCG